MYSSKKSIYCNGTGPLQTQLANHSLTCMTADIDTTLKKITGDICQTTALLSSNYIDDGFSCTCPTSTKVHSIFVFP